jgi:hypothetical protein
MLGDVNRVITAVMLAILAFACNSSSGDGSSGGGDAGAEAAYYPSCDGGCVPDAACAYPISASCGALGVCVPVAPCGGCGRQPTYCGCDGRGVVQSGDIPAGYSPAPVVQGAYPPCIDLDAGDDAGDSGFIGDRGDADAE